MSLEQVCERVTDGSHFTPPFVDCGYPFVTVANIDTNGRIDWEGANMISEEDFKVLERNDCRPKLGDVLFSKDGTVGKVSVVDFDTDFAVLSSLAILRPDRRLLNQGYLAHALKSAPILSQAIGRKTGSAIRRIVLRDLTQIQIPVPPLAEQERIVNLLDETDALRKLRAEADRRTAELVPALFLEMFGDPVRNEKGWKIVQLGELFDQSRSGAKCGPFGSALKKHEYQETGIPVWGIPNVLPNRFVEDQSLFISPDKFESLRGYEVRAGDLLISRAGTVGRICVARPSTNKSIFGTNLIRVALAPDEVVPEFVSTLLTFFAEVVTRPLRADASENSYSFMNTTLLKSLPLYLPPLDVQSDFVATVNSIRLLQKTLSASGDQVHLACDSLLYSKFGQCE
jgi:restriction endonuclease S subunit